MLNPYAPPDVPSAELSVLVWNDHWFGVGYEEPLMVTTPAGAKIDIRFTRDRDARGDVDAIWFHLPTLRDLPPKPGSGPPWVLASMEAYASYPLQSGPAAQVLFDLTMTHRLDADVPTPYANRRQYRGFRPPPRPTQDLTAPISYLASHPIAERDDFVRDLMAHVPVASYGSCLNNRTFTAFDADVADGQSTEDDRRGREAAAAVASHTFHLAFENIREVDYVTEKLYRCLAVGTIPVYRGAPNVAEFLPSPSAAVIVDGDTGPADLAAHLGALLDDPVALGEHRYQVGAESPAFSRLLDLGDVDPRARLATKLAHGCGRACGCGGRGGDRA